MNVPKEGFDTALGASYLLVQPVGRGATGIVWEATDRRTDETVAAKVLHSEHVSDPDVVGRFVRERSLLTALRHPNLVSIRDLVVEGERLAIVMDFVDGGSLREVLRSDGPLPPVVAVAVTAEVLDGLAAAHEQHLLHRDIKPDNVLLTQAWRDLGRGAVKLTDFGIARIVDERARVTTGLLGTPEYMSPELLTTGEADLPSDVYGIGIMLYELLAGRTPYAGPGTDYTIAHRHVSSEPPRLPVPDRLWEALVTMLDKDPSRRPTAARAAAQLRRQLSGLTDLPALAAQAQPDQFADAHGPMTVVRGVKPATPASDGDAVEDPRGLESLDDLDLGAPGQATTVRPMQRREPPVGPSDRPRRHREPEPPRARWKDPRVVAVVVGCLVLLAGAVVLVARMGGSHQEKPRATSVDAVAPATQRDDPKPSGLTISRNATYDPQTHKVDLTITYAAQNAPLRGPFLEIIPGSHGSCPSVTWQEGSQQQNLPSVTGITTRCGWSIEVGQVAAQSSTSVTATLSVPFAGKVSSEALQQWLDTAAGRTTAATSDAQITSRAYPAQRLQSIDVVAPSRTVSGRTLPVTLYPVWPSGQDKLNPLFRSPPMGRPSTLLTAIAGGERGVVFSDGCSGALAISRDRHVVIAQSFASNCEVDARVGNFDDLHSNPFSIVTRGS